jgi:hypothetical protein
MSYVYPEDEDLKRVAEHKCEWLNDGKHPVFSPWFALIKSMWWMPDWGWHEFDGFDDGDPVRVLNISTGGWSGNESLIGAMRQNFIGWSMTFYSIRRGGHYEFRFPRLVESPQSGPHGRGGC